MIIPVFVVVYVTTNQTALNGTVPNGISFNVTVLHGTANGTSPNGIAFNVTVLHGITPNRTVLNGTSNGKAFNVTVLHGKALNGTSTNKRALNGTGLNGTATYKKALNGTVLNTTAANVTDHHGISPNGTSLNRTATNGTARNIHGITPNGTALKTGAARNITVLNGTATNGTALNGTATNGTALNRTTLNGTVFHGKVKVLHGTPVNATADKEYVEDLVNLIYITHLELCEIKNLQQKTKNSYYGCVLSNGVEKTKVKTKDLLPALMDGLGHCGEIHKHHRGKNIAKECTFYKNETVAEPYFQCMGHFVWKKSPMKHSDVEIVISASEKCMDELKKNTIQNAPVEL